MTLSDQLRALITVGPARGEQSVAARAAVSVAVPMLVLLCIGHIEWSLYATFGAFSSVYGRGLPIVARVRAQAMAGSALTLSVIIGVLIGISPVRSWLMIPIAAVWATLIAYLAHRWQWHPPGPLFTVFALGACASVPATWSGLPIAALVAICAVAFALLITLTFAVVARGWRRARRLPPPSRAPVPPPPSRPLITWRLRHYPIRYAVAVAIAGLLATSIGVIGHPYWAMVAAVVPMSAPDPTARILRAVHRLLGTLLGVIIAWGLLSLDLPPLAVIGIAALLQACTELFIGRNYGLALLFITPLALSMTQLAHPLPITGLIRDRALETFLGVAVAVVITLLTRERRQDPDAD